MGQGILFNSVTYCGNRRRDSRSVRFCTTMKFNIIDKVMHTDKSPKGVSSIISMTNINFIHRPKFIPVVVSGAVVDSMGHFEESNQISV